MHVVARCMDVIAYCDLPEGSPSPRRSEEAAAAAVHRPGSRHSTTLHSPIAPVSQSHHHMQLSCCAKHLTLHRRNLTASPGTP